MSAKARTRQLSRISLFGGAPRWESGLAKMEPLLAIYGSF